MYICTNIYENMYEYVHLFQYHHYLYHISFSFSKTILIKYPISIALSLVWFPNPLAAGSGFKVRWGPCLQSFISCLRKLKHELNKILLEIEIFGNLNVVVEKHCLQWNDIFNWFCNWSILCTYMIFVIKKNMQPKLFRQKNYTQNKWFATFANS